MRASMRCSTRQLNAAAAAGDEPDADRRRASATRQSGRPGVGQQHADQRAEDDQLHDARLGQRVELAQLGVSETLRGGATRREGFRHRRIDSMKPAPARRRHRAKTRVARHRRAAHEQHGQDDDQRRGARRVRHRGRERPAEQHIAEAARRLPGDQRRASASAQRRVAAPATMQAPAEQRERRQQRRSAPSRCAMWIAVSAANGRNRRRRRCRARAAATKPWPKSIVRPPACPGRSGSRCRRAPRSWC